jgi:hypothetical protein
MSTRFRCITPAQSIAILQASCANWPELASFLDPGEAYCGSRDHSIAEPPTSTAGPRQRARRDRRDARMDAVGVGRALDIRDVFAGAQTLASARPSLPVPVRLSPGPMGFGAMNIFTVIMEPNRTCS